MQSGSKDIYYNFDYLLLHLSTIYPSPFFMQTPKMWSNILYLLGPANDAQAKNLTKLGRMGCIMSQVGFPGSQVDTEFFIKFTESAWNKMETKNVIPN